MLGVGSDTIPALPPTPGRPAALNDLIRANNAAVLAFRKACRQHPPGAAYLERATTTMFTAQKAVRDWWTTADGVAHRVACETYNAVLETRQAFRVNEQQARANAAVVAAVRTTACPRCFASHPGEC
jgi:hypothetical protein